MVIALISIFIIFIFFTLIACGCCSISGKMSRVEEALQDLGYSGWVDIGKLNDLERESFNKLLEEFKKHKKRTLN